MRRWRDSSGVGLIEVMVALSLFSIAAAGITALSISTTAQNRTSNVIATASALTQDLIERLHSLDPESNPADLVAGTHYDTTNPIAPFGANGSTFTRTWTVQSDTPAPGIAEVVVKVVWSGTPAYSTSGVTFICTSQTCS